MNRIIPAIDLIEGKCVRLTRGDYNTKVVYDDDPLNVAKRFEDNGIQFLHLVDLDGAKARHIKNQSVLQRISRETSLSVDFGGGIKSDEDIEIAFDSGASQVNLGSIAVVDPVKTANWITKYGPEKIIIGADSLNGFIATHGWKQSSDLNISEFISSYLEQGALNFCATDISADGTLEGPNFQLYRDLQDMFPSGRFIASGGISSIEDVRKLASMNMDGIIVGKAIYEGKVTLEQLLSIDAN